MSKMGISVISAYRGGYNFEAVGLSRAVVSDYFPGMVSRISGIGILGIEEKIKDLPEDLSKYNLEINEDRMSLIYTYNVQAERKFNTYPAACCRNGLIRNL